MDKHLAAVRATDRPDDVEAIDYLAATDEEGGERRIQLFPKMRPEQLKERLEKVNVRSIMGAHLQCSDETWPDYCQLLQAVQPGIKMTELPCTEAGVHRRQGRTFCTTTVRYFQAIAKIAFHYYLIHSKRNLRGNEAIFQDIRNFIVNGGDKDRIVASYQQRPVSPLPTSLKRSDWSHFLAANESESTLKVRLQLFSGPDSPTLIHHVTVGELGDCVVVPKFVWGHKYRYYAREKASGRFIGIVERLPIVGLPGNFWVPPSSVAY